MPPATAATPTAQPLSPWEVAWLLPRAADGLAESERRSLDAIRQADPALATAVDLTRAFVAMVRGRQPGRLDDWLRTAAASGVAEFERLAAGVERDKAAVAAAVAERWSNGQTEGQVLRLKLIKRQGYGRANVDLLRQRVLRAARVPRCPAVPRKPCPGSPTPRESRRFGELGGTSVAQVSGPVTRLARAASTTSLAIARRALISRIRAIWASSHPWLALHLVWPATS